MAKAIITQTGPDSAVVEPIVLRPGDLTRMVFKPQIVNNKQDENKPVRGHLLWQKRGGSEVRCHRVSARQSVGRQRLRHRISEYLRDE